jgi:uncharacterized protein (TIGR02246 family)
MNQTAESALVALSHAYADAVRRGDADRWGALWTDDAVWVLGPGRRIVGREAIVTTWRQSLSKYIRVVQLYHSSSYQLGDDHDTAHGRIQLTELIEVADGSRRILAGHYDDEFVLTGDGWRFAARHLTQYYNGPPGLTGTFFEPPPA